MIPALRNAIYTLGKTVTGLSATNFFYERAKQGADLPYCRFVPISNPYDFDSGSVFEECYVQFDFFGSNLSTLETLSTAFKAVFDFGKASLSVTGYDVVTCVRMFSVGPVKPDKVWQISVQYKIELQKAR